MAQSFGARLRQHREAQHVALTAVAEQTKIKVSLLEGLERDDLAHWPSGIFRRAYIRAYAHAIGLNPDAIVHEFLDVHPEPMAFDVTAAITAAAERSRPGAPPTRLRNIVDSAIGSLSRLRRNHATDDGPIAGMNPMQQPATPRDQVARTAPAGARATHAEPMETPGTPPLVDAEPLTPDLPTTGSPKSEAVADLAIGTAGGWAATATSSREPVEVFGLAVDSDAFGAGKVSPGEERDEARGLVPAAPDFDELARLCTDLGRVAGAGDLQRLLQEAANVLDASGLIVWLWDPTRSCLMPALAHGYSERVLAQLPGVQADANNATAAAYRLAQPCAIDGTADTNAALVVPLLVPGRCAGVLALELRQPDQDSNAVRAAATIIAAVLAQLVGATALRSEGVLEG